MPQGGQWPSNAFGGRKKRAALRVTVGAAFLAGTLMIGVPPAVPATPDQVTNEAETRFAPSPVQGEVGAKVTPIGLDQAQPVTVMLELAGDPVAVTQSKVGGKVASPAGVQQKADLAARQDALKGAIASQGGTVLAQHQITFNGMTVTIARDRIDALRALPDVVAVHQVQTFELDNAESVPYIGAPSVWEGVDGLHGEHIKVGIIDTGIDYTHANFGGPGTPAAYTAAHATETQPADPTMFGPSAPKVKGGTDLVGDGYDASTPSKSTPHPDPNPLDCNGHGSHVAGTAAGFGVTADGKTYHGPYDLTTPSKTFTIGPGVAPLADLYAIRVFGCNGSTSTAVVVQAIDWAVEHGLDVVNMSLGSSFGSGSESDPEIVASNNAVLAGTMVVASAGNSGPNPYIVGRPSSATRAISVAAVDSHPSFRGATVSLSTGQSVVAINANNATLPGGSIPVMVLRNTDGSVSLGCDEAEYAHVAGTLVVTLRGSCARVDRATFGQKHGARAVAMINTSTAYPPLEGPIDGVTIPFLGVRGNLGSSPASDGDKLVAADHGTATLAETSITNPGFRGFADFTSGGPRRIDSALKPDISAPGVSIASTGIGTGNQAAVISGTSMAAPHVTGVAALAIQAHPGWDIHQIRSAIVETGDASKVANYSPRLGGGGLVQPLPATRTLVSSFAAYEVGTSTLNFGFNEMDANFNQLKREMLKNHTGHPISFNVSSHAVGSTPHTLNIQSSITLAPWSETGLDVTLNVPASSIGDSAAMRQVTGLITLTPSDPSQNNGVSLNFPYYMVPRGVSTIEPHLQGELTASHTTSQIRLTNGGPITGTADFYAWGLDNSAPVTREPPTWLPPAWELNEVGVSSSPRSFGQLLVFAVNTRGRWSTASTNEFDILISTTGGKFPDYDVVGLDFGLVTGGAFDGRMGSFVFKLDPATGATISMSIFYLASAPSDKSTILLPVRSTQLGLTAAQPRFAYAAEGFDILSPGTSVLPGPASYNAWHSAVSQGQFASVAPGASVNVPVSFDPAEEQITPALGFMIVGLENLIGDAQARVIPVAVPEAPAEPLAPAVSVRAVKPSGALNAPTGNYRAPKLASPAR